ncbi:protein EMSY-LIKE 3-like isoform X2 [Olea europaea var. sylvestris]|uniref:protein EMSY-LIKE 3-like isoform X2 n=1 Tax=Olea europaea var. sylvestris TaxID=158386 RepID=UPI000C1D09CC|nr:protein EMSY-LIKE 3-like isoform X2 [Olea europaea var. sylvestris]
MWTEDDLPHQNRIQRGGGTAGNGRPSIVGSVPYPRIYDETDMEDKIHLLEQEAYRSVLRAFKAQADAITWEKESLITELRKELRLSNEEHRELLGQVNVDETIQRIREWRLSGGFQPGMHGVGQTVHGSLPPSFPASHKKEKIAFGGPSLFPSQSMNLANQPPSSAVKHGPIMGLKSQQHKRGQIPPGASSIKMQYPSSISAGRGQFGNRISSGGLTGGSFDPLIGRKVRTRWPDDNNFYEAVIADYSPAEGLHALVYDMGTPHETSEWVNFAEIPPGDVQWEGEDPGSFHHGGYGSNRPIVRESAPGAGRGRGLNKSQSGKDFLPSRNGIGDAGDGVIEIFNTDALIEKVERIFGHDHQDPMDIEKAKKLLKDHEQELTNVLARLASISDGEDDDGDLGHGHPMD